MGYYTRFELEVYKAHNLEEVDEFQEVYGLIAGKLEDLSEYHALFRDQYEAKWYNYDDDCKEVSALFPDYYIQIAGYGEESGDVWREVFHNGETVAKWYQPQPDYPLIDELLDKYEVNQEAQRGPKWGDQLKLDL